MSDTGGYVLGQNERAARRLEIQDRHFGAASERLLDELAIRPTDRVVEFGCGAGSFSRRVLTRLGPGGVLVGVDTTPGLLDQAKAALTGKGTGRFEPTSAAITSLGSWLDGADVVLGRADLHHVPMAELFIGRLRALSLLAQTQQFRPRRRRPLVVVPGRRVGMFEGRQTVEGLV